MAGFVKKSYVITVLMEVFQEGNWWIHYAKELLRKRFTQGTMDEVVQGTEQAVDHLSVKQALIPTTDKNG